MFNPLYWNVYVPVSISCSARLIPLAFVIMLQSSVVPFTNTPLVSSALIVCCVIDVSNIECGRANPSLTVLVKIANFLECSIDYFISHEYTYNADKDKEMNLDDKIMYKLKYCDSEKKHRVLQMIDLL